MFVRVYVLHEAPVSLLLWVWDFKCGQQVHYDDIIESKRQEEEELFLTGGLLQSAWCTYNRAVS